MSRARSMLVELPARSAALLDRIRRLLDPRRWSAAVRILADLLNGGLVVPPPEKSGSGRGGDETPVEIYSVIQPDGDHQLKVTRSLLESDDAEARLAAHLEEVGEALQRVRDATGQVLLLRLAFALSSLWAMLDPLWRLAAGMAEGARPSALLGPLDWLFIGGGALLLLAGIVFPKLLGWFVRRRLGALARDLKASETQSYAAEAGEA